MVIFSCRKNESSNDHEIQENRYLYLEAGKALYNYTKYECGFERPVLITAKKDNDMWIIKSIENIDIKWEIIVNHILTCLWDNTVYCICDLDDLSKLIKPEDIYKQREIDLKVRQFQMKLCDKIWRLDIQDMGIVNVPADYESLITAMRPYIGKSIFADGSLKMNYETYYVKK